MRQRRDFDAHVLEYAALKIPAFPFQAEKRVFCKFTQHQPSGRLLHDQLLMAAEIFDAQVTCFCGRMRLVIAYASWDASWEPNFYTAIPDNSGGNMHQGEREVTKYSH